MQLVAQPGAADRRVEDRPSVRRQTNWGRWSTPKRQSVIKWIKKGVEEGATPLALDGRGVTSVPGYENGFYLGPTLFDHVTSGISIRRRGDLGPVLCINRVKDFEEGLAVVNANEFANGSVIYTQSGYYAPSSPDGRTAAWWASTWASRCRWASSASPATRLVLRRSARHGNGRRTLLHRAEERDQRIGSRRPRHAKAGC